MLFQLIIIKEYLKQLGAILKSFMFTMYAHYIGDVENHIVHCMTTEQHLIYKYRDRVVNCLPDDICVIVFN